MKKEKCPNCNETMEPVSVNCACPECHTMLNHVDFDFELIAIEFGKWVSTQRDYSFCKSKNVWTLYGKSGEFDLTSKQLFDKFIEQLNKA